MMSVVGQCFVSALSALITLHYLPLIDRLHCLSQLAHPFATKPKQGVDPKQRRKDHRIVVGHNVAFDRARIADDYSIEPSNLGIGCFLRGLPCSSSQLTQSLNANANSLV